MSKPKIVEETPISIVELKAEINKIKKRDEELGFRSAKTEEYVNSFAKISQAKAKELYEEVEKLKVPRVTHENIIKIIDILPKNAEEVKVVLNGFNITVTKENQEKIASLVKKVIG